MYPSALALLLTLLILLPSPLHTVFCGVKREESSFLAGLIKNLSLMFDGPFIFHVLQYFMLLDHLHIHNPEVSELNRRCVKVINLNNEV